MIIIFTMFTVDELAGLHLRGSFQRDTKHRTPEMGGDDGHSFNRYILLVEILSFSPKGILIARGQDHFGESALVGKVINVRDSRGELPSERLPVPDGDGNLPRRGLPILFDKVYLDEPYSFPTQFFGNLSTIPYDLTGAMQFRSVAYFGSIFNDSGVITCRGIYQPAHMSRAFSGIWELSSQG